MRDEDDRGTVSGQPTNDPDELLNLLGCEDRRRLIEDQDLCAPVEGLQDLDALLLADSDVLNEGVWIDRKSEALRELKNPRARGTLVEEYPTACGLGSEDDVLGNGHHRHEHEVLMHHADPTRDRVARRREGGEFASDRNRSPVGRIEPVEDVHER